MTSLFVFFLLLTEMTASSVAAEKIEWGAVRNITRAEAVQYALENAEAVEIASESAETIRARGRQITAFYRPQLQLQGEWTEMGDNGEPNPFFETPDRNLSVQIIGNRVLYAGGRIWNSRALKSVLYRQADDIEAVGMRDIRKGVKLAFDTALFEQTLLTILKDRRVQRRNELDDAEDLREVGMVTSLDVRQARLGLSVVEDELKAETAACREALILFNQAVGRSGGDDLWGPAGRLDDIPGMHEIAGKLRRALEKELLLDIRFRKNEAEAARLQLEIAKGERRPELALVSTASTGGEEAGEMDESWTFGLRMNWDIFDGGLVRAGTDEARAGLRMAEAALSRTRKELAGSIETMDFNIRTLESRVRLQKAAVELAKENYDDARGQYRAGTITQTRLGDFHLAYAEARFALQRLYYAQRMLLSEAESLLEAADGFLPFSTENH